MHALKLSGTLRTLKATASSGCRELPLISNLVGRLSTGRRPSETTRHLLISTRNTPRDVYEAFGHRARCFYFLTVRTFVLLGVLCGHVIIIPCMASLVSLSEVEVMLDAECS